MRILKLLFYIPAMPVIMGLGLLAAIRRDRNYLPKRPVKTKYPSSKYLWTKK